ncbi:MAG TPA: hypothetical protein VHR38_10630 [Solirubrobacterales bacterium]|jgi:hypothetical protein|nr:hypothetical protein [Solirubrobacterales bacterium]
MADARLYVIPGSHPSRTAMLMLERKGIPFKRVDLLPVVSKGVLKVQRFAGHHGSGPEDRHARIAEGVLGGPEPNAADFQLGPSIRLLMSFDDLRPFIEGRPAGAMATRVVPDFPGRTPPVAPAEWLDGLR